MRGSFSVTVDLEDWYHIPSVCSSPYAVYRTVNEFFEQWDGRYDYLTEPTKRALDILDEFNVTATFFVVADIVEHYPGLVESIAEKGHEIACHGLHHACKINPETKERLMSNEEFEQKTFLAKRILEKVSGERVAGYRAPNAFVGGWMLDSLENIGFKYDSSVSVNSLYNKTDSFLKTVSSFPYYPLKNGLEVGGDRNFIEFPWAYYQNVLKIPASGGPILRFLGAPLVLNGLIQSLKRGHTIFYFHPIDISCTKFPSVGNNRPFYWCMKGKLVERRIRHILKALNDVKKVCLRDYPEI
ncbi:MULTISPECIES: polysaccharide deacetylase family protein [Methanosarcina]|uniref:Polysaccharide deacetylase n=3 Tax=Methanosarcina barkeri TaxID=2208 RepID=A0A0E3QZJ7_METBA|nr:MULTISPECIES: polysaccharide deacetylase family protein [Methanosarcina]AKB56357.1 Polysaccharide deacetylase [Methanosarcina barkeri MS]AKB59828.1 Polysaccharide deacetylase [Methanosarcina barkeri 227]AKJ40479.1 polysaccharide deacetylase family protein [Methanosarcina barkeri CM1]OEC93655.1 polysaccharide deacetylase [Methanosarcina sp. A14]